MKHTWNRSDYNNFLGKRPLGRKRYRWRILNWILEKEDETVYTEFILLKVRTSSRSL
jgi:hypothetical protein